jgi:hypothetical protein
VPFGLCSQIHAFSTQIGNGSSNSQTSSSPVKPSGTGNVSGLMYSRATRQVPEFRGRYRGRVDYVMMQKPERVRAFLIKYQDRVVYGTDNVLYRRKTGDVL